MNQRFIHRSVSLLSILGLMLVLAWMAGSFNDKIEPSTLVRQPDVLQQAVAVQLLQRDLVEAVPATVRAKQSTNISSRVLARITRIHVRSGDNVKKGQLLLELEQSDFVSRAQQAKEQMRQVEVRLTEARQNLDRVAVLYDKGLVAKSELDAVKAAHDGLVAEQARAAQAYTEAQAAVSYTRILAPIDGRVVDRFAEPGDTASPGAKLLSLYNPLSLRVEAQVREKLALAMTPGQRLAVHVPALGSHLEAELEEQVPAADTGSRSFLVKAQIAYDPRLMPGVYAQLLIPAGIERVLVIDRDRVRRIGQLDVVWVAAAGIERRFVRLGSPVGDAQVVVLAGLQEGEMVLPAPVN